MRMIRSMTAFAAAESETPWGALSFELRSVNHRYLELNPRLPEELRAIEPALRERVAAKLTRGKIDVNLRYRPNDAGATEIRLNDGMLDKLERVAGVFGERFPKLGTNFTDQWWNPNEPGWGASVLQQYDTLFVDLFVYGPDAKPVWYTAAVYFDSQSGGTLFSGDLYVASGPWFGAFFNPAAFTARRVGTLQFDAGDVDSATLTYSVDGVVVTKSIQRQLWTYEDFSGSYYGGFIYDQTSCANPGNNGHGGGTKRPGTALVAYTRPTPELVEELRQMMGGEAS
jgi:hypothetical protein